MTARDPGILRLNRICILVSVLCCLGFSKVNSQTQRLSGQAEVSLMTASPGDQLYSTFGHTAIRIKDPLNDIDRVYGFGTFDHTVPFFYLKFARGDLNYWIDTDPYRNTNNRYGFLEVYQYLRRGLNEQILNLSLEQKQNIFQYLEINMLPQNKYYRYDYLFDNCATRPRDVIFNILGKDAVLDNSFMENGLTFRDLIHRYLEDTPWTYFGIDLILGAVIDRPMKPHESMFIPDYLEKALDKTKVIKENGPYPLVKSKQVLLVQEARPSASILPTPQSLLWALAVALISITLGGWGMGRWLPIIDVSIFLIYGVAGLIMAFLWFGTLHSSPANNWNLIWAFPFHLIASLALLRRPKPEWLHIYLLLTGILSALLLLGWNWIPQAMHPAVLPLVLILGLRSFFMFRKIPAWPH